MAELSVVELRDQLLNMLEHAQSLRFDRRLRPSTEDGPAELHEKLVLARANLDSLEHLLVMTVTAASNQRGRVREAREAQEDAWAHASQTKKQPEYSSAKEREAAYSLASLETKIVLRKAEGRLAEAEFAVDQLRTMYRGLDGLRRDMETLLRAKSLATALER